MSFEHFFSQGWTDPYCGDVRTLGKTASPTDPKAPHPYGRIITGSAEGLIAVWALCCGERLAVWKAHQGTTVTRIFQRVVFNLQTSGHLEICATAHMCSVNLVFSLIVFNRHAPLSPTL